MTILLAAADDNVIDAARSAFEHAGPSGSTRLTVVRGGVECLDAVRRLVPDLLILDEHVPWGGAEGVLAILEECGEGWIDELPILLLTDGNRNVAAHGLRTYPFARSCCRRKLAEVVDMFEYETAGL